MVNFCTTFLFISFDDDPLISKSLVKYCLGNKAVKSVTCLRSPKAKASLIILVYCTSSYASRVLHKLSQHRSVCHKGSGTRCSGRRRPRDKSSKGRVDKGTHRTKYSTSKSIVQGNGTFRDTLRRDTSSRRRLLGPFDTTISGNTYGS